MVYQSKDHQSVFVNCSCGCGEGLEIRLNKYSQEEGDICISMVESKWYSEQIGGWAHLKKKVKRLWRLVCNKDYYYSELILKNEQLTQLIEALQILQEKEEAA